MSYAAIEIKILPKKLPKIVKEIQKATPPPVNYAYQKGISI